MRRDPAPPRAGAPAPPVALTEDERVLVRRCNQDPDAYVAVPVQGELNQNQPIVLGQVPTPAGVQKLWALTFTVYVREEMAAYNDMIIDRNGSPSHPPTRGMLPAAQVRLVLPRAQITEEGWALLDASAVAHARQDVRGWDFDPAPMPYAPGVTRWVYRRGTETRMAALRMGGDIVVMYEDGEMLARVPVTDGWTDEDCVHALQTELTRGRPGRLILPGRGLAVDHGA